ncbi:hypothetical protein RR48_05668 [Papilio machaon]|uniref:A-kinase anchor protein 2 C-terminal domain-containing protein n=1 Tax=Papilio machaon TaxID=76193 RepID=A0A0N0PD48_PAPMA|nr:hypothetical protein RR48_05668 [Papilio machaon]
MGYSRSSRIGRWPTALCSPAASRQPPTASFPASLKEDPLSRIQREIIEVTEREREFKEGHFRMNRLLSESTVDVAKQNGHVNGDATDKPQRTLSRAVSTSQLMGPVTPSPPPPTQTLLHTNGYTRRFTPQTGTKGIMQRFIASKGKLSVGTSPVSPPPPVGLAPQPILSPAALAPITIAPAAITRTPEGKPVRKGYVPVEEKIQKELQEMKDREHELKKMRRRQKPFDIELSEAPAPATTRWVALNRLSRWPSCASWRPARSSWPRARRASSRSGSPSSSRSRRRAPPSVPRDDALS